MSTTEQGGAVERSTCDWTHNPQENRLHSALVTAELRLASLELKLGRTAAASDTTFQTCRRSYERALENARNKARYCAWDCLHQFDEDMLNTMSPLELNAQWRELCAEAQEKLKGTWRGEAAAALIKQSDQKDVPLELVRALQAQLATAARNQQHKLELLEQSVLYVTVLLAVVVVAVLVWSIATRLGYLGWWSITWADAFLLGIPSGALGGLLSMAFMVFRTDLKRKIPEMRFTWTVSLLRPLIGASVAIPVLVLIQSGYVSIKGLDWPYDIIAFCFLAGFSERWFLGLMERFESEKKSK
jgi:hypothetical protein